MFHCMTRSVVSVCAEPPAPRTQLASAAPVSHRKDRREEVNEYTFWGSIVTKPLELQALERHSARHGVAQCCGRALLIDVALCFSNCPAVAAVRGHAGLRPAQGRGSGVPVKDTRLVAELLARS